MVLLIEESDMTTFICSLPPPAKAQDSTRWLAVKCIKKWHQKLFYDWHKTFHLSSSSQVMETKNIFIGETFLKKRAKNFFINFEKMEKVLRLFSFLLSLRQSFFQFSFYFPLSRRCYFFYFNAISFSSMLFLSLQRHFCLNDSLETIFFCLSPWKSIFLSTLRFNLFLLL